VTGIERIRRAVLQSHRETFDNFACGSHPATLFITCCGSSIDPSLLTKSSSRAFVVLRNAGNTVPVYGTGCDREAAVIDYAVGVLKVRDAVICGHSLCDAINTPSCVPRSDASGTSDVRRRHHDPSPRQCGSYDTATLFDRPIDRNVVAQINNLRTHPAVILAERKGALIVHGWVFEQETQDVWAYRPDVNRFERMINRKAA
jgi:carbonic anhydrase